MNASFTAAVVYGIGIVSVAVAAAAFSRWWRLRNMPPRPDPAKLAAELLGKRPPRQDP